MVFDLGFDGGWKWSEEEGMVLWRGRRRRDSVEGIGEAVLCVREETVMQEKEGFFVLCFCILPLVSVICSFCLFGSMKGGV